MKGLPSISPRNLPAIDRIACTGIGRACAGPRPGPGDVALTELGFNRDAGASDYFPIARSEPEAALGVLAMRSFHQFSSFAASRGEGLHPKLHALLERATASPVSVLSMRHDGLVQAGPDPDVETALLRANVVLLRGTK